MPTADEPTDVELAAKVQPWVQVQILRWLYRPYDGRADVYPAIAAHRDELRERQSQSTHPSGR